MSRPLLDRYVSTSHRRLRRLMAAQFAGASIGLVGSVVIASGQDGGMLRIGAILMALLFAAVLAMLFRAPRGRDVSAAIAEPSIEAYRAELDRHRALFSGFRLWSRLVFGIPVAAVVCAGIARSNPALARVAALEFAVIIAGLTITCLLAHRKARRYQQEIDELDALRQ